MIPNMKKKEDFFEGNIRLESWENFWKEKLNLVLNIGGDCLVDSITSIHENGFNYLILKQRGILDAILGAIYKNYNMWQQEYDYTESEKEYFMPDLNAKDELKTLIKPKRIFIMDVAKEEIPYIGVEFECRWDEEHGIGVMLYKNKVISIGGADNAFMSWIAEEDLER